MGSDLGVHQGLRRGQCSKMGNASDKEEPPPYTEQPAPNSCTLGRSASAAEREATAERDAATIRLLTDQNQKLREEALALQREMTQLHQDRDDARAFAAGSVVLALLLMLGSMDPSHGLVWLCHWLLVYPLWWLLQALGLFVLSTAVGAAFTGADFRATWCSNDAYTVHRTEPGSPAERPT